VDAETLLSDEARERSEFEDGPALSAETVRRLGCDASVVRIIERDGHPLSVGRRKRTIPAALRRALRSRDGGRCCFPGCTHLRFLHAHHIRHWAHGGLTSLDNLVQLCSHHHRLVHEGGFAVERAGPHGVRFRRPDGRPIAEQPRAAPVNGPGLEHRNRGVGVSVDAKTCMPRSAGDSIDYGLAVELLAHQQFGGARAP
jgi:5-methylcytosine-specific restriction endonuclease McrA